MRGKKKRREVKADRGRYKNTAYKRTTSKETTHRTKASHTEIIKEMVKESEYSDYPVAHEQAYNFMKHFPKVLTTLLKKKGEVTFVGFGTFCNILVKESKKTRKYFSSDEDFKKLNACVEHIRTVLLMADLAKSTMNERPTVPQKIEKNKKERAAQTIVNERERREEEAALTLFFEFYNKKAVDILLVDKIIEEQQEIVYWNDRSCFNNAKTGKPSRQLPVRPEEVKKRIIGMITEKGDGDRYISTWDKQNSIAALKARGIPYDVKLWVRHVWTYEKYMDWKINKTNMRRF